MKLPADYLKFSAFLSKIMQDIIMLSLAFQS